ncbi:MAG TPA: methionyl-tRNA formyltransferase [Allosphingosinicella sp.]|nr:methionyl-tRNA formyltransferase [Allosphingosinicella sp.]
MRIVFMGTPDFAVPTLDRLIERGHDIAAVYCRPPRPAGRGKALRPCPVQRRAEAAGIEVRTPTSLRDAETQAAFAALRADAAVVAAYGLILPRPVLDAPRQGCFNVHASLLPRWRGAAPVQRAILAGDPVTGVSIMRMEEGLDTGPLLGWMPVTVGRKTAGEVAAEIAALGAELMADALDNLHRIGQRPQNDALATYAPKIDKAEAKIDFSRSAIEIERQVRAFNPVPGAWFELRGERIKLLAGEPVEADGAPGTVLEDLGLTIACGKDAIAATLVQRAGRAPMGARELLRGFPIPAGTRIG